jgi:uroporphyrinogen III methyltransferase/synthase
VVQKGFVYLVGAGPGRADLITVRGADLLKEADCIIYDKLANPALLKFARPDVELIAVPKRISAGSVTQTRINELIVEKASAGKTVVRLKGGDPCVFGRCAEELAVLIESGIDFEIVPGVTAAIAAADYSGIILTDREYSSQVVFVTGQEAEGKQQTNIDWQLLAKFPGTMVFYMAVSNLGSIAERLIKNGMKPDTPAAVVADATFPTQKVVKAALIDIDRKCKDANIEPPAIVIIGAAANPPTADQKLNWFMKKPLFGKNIVLTRDPSGNAEFAEKIIHRGGNPIQFPTMTIKPLTQTNEYLQALTALSEYEWIVFTSANGVTIFFESLRDLGKDGRVIGSAKVAAIGEQTAARLAEFGIRADFVPGEFTSKELALQLAGFANLKNKKVLLVRSELASNELVEHLQKSGAAVHSVSIYTAVKTEGKTDWLLEKIRDNQVHWLTFASPSSAKMFFEQFPPVAVNSSGVQVASIGPVTSEQLQQLGVRVDVTAVKHTIEGLLDAIEQSNT